MDPAALLPIIHDISIVYPQKLLVLPVWCAQVRSALHLHHRSLLVHLQWSLLLSVPVRLHNSLSVEITLFCLHDVNDHISRNT